MIVKIPQQQEKYKVLCNCMTFNQASFIVDTMNGFVSQITTFPFVCCIIDDCSSDGEQEVIREYLKKFFEYDNAIFYDTQISEIIVSNHKSNRNCFFAVYFLKRNLWKEPKLKEELLKPWRDCCEYEAYCEGDDYWTQPNKLQLQSDYLDTHLDVGLVCHNFDRYNSITKNIHTNVFRNKDILTKNSCTTFNLEDNFVKIFYTQLLTIMFRIDKRDMDFVTSFNYCRDVHYVYDVLTKTRGCYMNFVGATYRLSHGSTYSDNSTMNIHKIGVSVYSELYNKTKSSVIRKVLFRQKLLLKIDQSSLFYRLLSKFLFRLTYYIF